MRKLLLISTMLVTVSISTFAGGLLTNTNQHAAWVRMIARGASIDIDGVYSNPAGLVFMEDGFYMSLNAQSVYQTRTINSSFGTYPSGEIFNKKYKGKANAPVVPSMQAVYKKGDWAFSGSFAIVGGGGKAKFDDGLPLFDSKIMAGLYQLGVSSDLYTLNSSMHGRQYIYGLQLGASYKINEYLGVFAGARINYVNSGYEGFLDANYNDGSGKVIPSVELDVDQSGWGITPIVGVDLKYGKWNLGVKYELLTSLHIKNKTKVNTDPDGVLSEYKDGVNTPHDIPSLFSAAIGYEFLPNLRATVEYHHFFDKNARMAKVSIDGNEGYVGKQKTLKHGTHEFLVGAEWDITDLVSISAGYQKTNYGVTKAYQTDTAFSLDSYTIGFGAALNLSSKIKLNVGYFWTTYDDFTKSTLSYNNTMLPGTDTYSRTNKVFGIGIDYKF